MRGAKIIPGGFSAAGSYAAGRRSRNSLWPPGGLLPPDHDGTAYPMLAEPRLPAGKIRSNPAEVRKL